MARKNPWGLAWLFGVSFLTAGLSFIDEDEIVRDMLKDYEIKEECGFYESVERIDPVGRRGTSKEILTFIYNNKKIKYYLLNYPAFVALESSNIPIGSAICITTYQRDYSYSRLVAVSKISVDAEVIYYDESRPSHKGSFIWMGLGLAILVVYWLFIRRK